LHAPTTLGFSIDPVMRRASCDPRDPGFVQDPYAFYAHLHEEARAVFWEDYGMWCFAGWDEVNALLRDKRFGRQILHVASRQELGWSEPSPHTRGFDAVEAHSLLNIEPPDHTRLRTLVNRAFVSRQVEHLRPVLRDMAEELVDRFEPNGRAELIAEFAAPLPVAIIAEMLGVPTEMAPQLLAWSHRMVQMYMARRDEAVEIDANAAASEFAAYVRRLADEKRKRPDEGLISYMISTEHRGQRLTDDELVSTTILLLNAGHEATVHQAGNAIKTLLEHADRPSGLFSTPETSERTVEEALRFDAPLHLFTRYALGDIDLGDGVVLKKGDEIGLMLAAANRDPQRFANAATFDPQRTDGANVSFGAGIHFCIGAPLARIELQEALSVLFERLPGLRLAETPLYADKYHFHGLERLAAAW
jgi:cytochrome P450